ncbi:MAG: DNA methyltransferase, partial [Bacteroidia bacterium]|nr:DNA methyltransferase [Bacteroidia bacterium]
REIDVISFAKRKVTKFLKVLNFFSSSNNLISTESLCFQLKDNFIDYIFTDPPFGSNIMYSELNFIWESWLKVKTNNKPEAIINKTQNKGLEEYFELMKAAFKEYYRVLKPGKWMTVEFSNTSAAIWNSIQSAIQRAGFVIASVATLDKQQGSFKAVTTPTAVKQDLILSCYKPVEEVERAILEKTGADQIQIFIEDLLKHLPIVRIEKGEVVAVAERQPKILYDKLLIYCISHQRYVPMDAREFQEFLSFHFYERHGSYYTAEQAKEYDAILAQRNQSEPKQVTLFITNEQEAVAWLQAELKQKPQRVQDLLPRYMSALATDKREIIRELPEILEDNFIEDSDNRWRLPREEEKEEYLRRRRSKLGKEFERLERAIESGERLKQVRRDVVLFGMERYYETEQWNKILKISKGLPKGYVEEDEQLFMYYEIAKQNLEMEALAQQKQV